MWEAGQGPGADQRGDGRATRPKGRTEQRLSMSPGRSLLLGVKQGHGSLDDQSLV